MSDKKKDKDKKKKKQSVLEAEIFRFMEKSLKSAMEVCQELLYIKRILNWFAIYMKSLKADFLS